MHGKHDLPVVAKLKRSCSSWVFGDVFMTV